MTDMETKYHYRKNELIQRTGTDMETAANPYGYPYGTVPPHPLQTPLAGVQVPSTATRV